MADKYYTESNFEGEDSNIDLKEEALAYLKYWKWFALSLIIALGASFLYLRYTPLKYFTSAHILLKDQKGDSQNDYIKESLGLGGVSIADVSDQIKALSSYRLVSKVVANNKLNIEYSTVGRFGSNDVAENESPAVVVFNNRSAYLDPDFSGYINAEVGKKSIEVTESSVIPPGIYKYGQKIKTKYDSIRFERSNLDKTLPVEINIRFKSIENQTMKFQGALNFTGENKGAFSRIIDISMISTNVEIAKTFLNGLIEIYDQDIQDDSQAISKASADFIQARLEFIEKNLGGIDRSKESFKAGNKIMNIDTESDISAQDVSNVDREIVELNAQLLIVEQLSQNLNESHETLLPTYVGIKNANINTGVDQFNNLMLQKQDISKSAKEDNPIVQNLDQSLTTVRRNVSNSLNLYQNNLMTQLGSLQNKKSGIISKIGRMPRQESILTSISRDQQIIESVYMYLLQKREEAEIKAAGKVNAFKVLDYARSSGYPVSPNRNKAYLIGMVLGLGIPFGIIYLMFLLDSKVRTREDLRKYYKGSILGEIPKSDEKEPIITEEDRTAFAESFKTVRSNLKFMLEDQSEKSKVIMVTSTIKGEGKSLISSNLAQTLGLINKNVILVSADLRHSKLLDTLKISKNQMKGGVSNMLAQSSLTMKGNLMVKPNDYKFDFLPSGEIPPNPSELLMKDSFGKLINKLKEKYDYVIIDCTPIIPIGDALNMRNLADLTIYLVRLNYLDKRMLAKLNEVTDTNVFSHMTVLINGIDYSGKGYYGYGYTYGYTENSGSGLSSLKNIKLKNPLKSIKIGKFNSALYSIKNKISKPVSKKSKKKK